MSRLIVKNLPKVTTEEKLRHLFSEYGTITDIQLKYTKNGNFRNFGFVGFRTEDEADKAIQFLNNTFLTTSKISVEKCATLGDSSKPKAWSKYASDSTAFKKANVCKKIPKEEKPKEEKYKKKETEVVELMEKYKDDPMFEEFLQVHIDVDKLEKLKQTHQKSFKDETKDIEEHSSDEKVAIQPISDMEYMKMLMPGAERKPRQKMEKKVKEKVKLFNLKLMDLPYKFKKKDIKDFFVQNIPFSIRIPRNIKGIAFVGYKNEKAFKKALTKDKSFLKGKQIRVVHYESKGPVQQNIEVDLKSSRWKCQEEALKNEEGIAESGKIFVRNLAYTTTEKDLEDLFSKHGTVAEVNMPIDSVSKNPKGFATITFMLPEHAVKAYSELDGNILHGRMIHLLPGKANDIVNNKDEDLFVLKSESSNYKQQKAAKQKSQAGSSHNWNTLFLGHDAVAQVIADTYEVSKEAVLGPEAKGSAAVRLAMGETQIVAQTKKYLEEQGVLVDVFNSVPKSRSKTVILIKNLPSKTEGREIKEIFEKHGELGRVILPPSGISAIVEFIQPSEARKAFLKLAYSKFKNVPLYLEWAPENSLLERKPEVQQEVKENVKEESEEEELEPEPETTLFVKNLNFQTTDEGLRQHFQNCGKIKYATVATKKDTSNPGGKLSMGYGFVQFYLKSSADKALKTLQQSVLDGKSLELKRSERTLNNEVVSTRKTTKFTKQTGSKILVRNVPFQANKKEIFELFSGFGQIRALRLPKKLGPGANTHRGFAFIDYTSQTDAKSAFEALSQSTHLYGRRLVLEWATTEEGVEDIRKRTAEHFGSKEEVKSKKSVFNIE